MILEENEIDHFDHDFEVFENNRMYPPNHTGETMLRIDDRHLKAIARAIHFVRSGITVQMTEKLRDSIDRDITLLDEAHKFCRQQIIEPGLPLIPESIGQGNNGEKDGSEDNTTSD